MNTVEVAKADGLEHDGPECPADPLVEPGPGEEASAGGGHALTIRRPMTVSR
jgi:hypothetical protein